MVLSYRNTRRWIGILGMTLPPLIYYGTKWLSCLATPARPEERQPEAGEANDRKGRKPRGKIAFSRVRRSG